MLGCWKPIRVLVCYPRRNESSFVYIQAARLFFAYQNRCTIEKPDTIGTRRSRLAWNWILSTGYVVEWDQRNWVVLQYPSRARQRHRKHSDRDRAHPQQGTLGYNKNHQTMTDSSVRQHSLFLSRRIQSDLQGKQHSPRHSPLQVYSHRHGHCARQTGDAQRCQGGAQRGRQGHCHLRSKWCQARGKIELLLTTFCL